MHHSAYVNAEKFYKEYCQENIESKKILDVGSYDVNGSLRPIFEAGEYVGLDIEPGPNVDVVGNSNDIPFKDQFFDITLSSSQFEHDDMFWLTFLEMCRVTKPGGYIYIQAPSNGPYHAHPVDNWRFYIDSWVALEKWGINNGYPIKLISRFIDKNTPDPHQARIWDDSVAIYRVEESSESSFDLKTIEAGHHRVTYRGITATKCPFDYVTYQMIVNEVKPDLIIEIGTYFGGASVYLADLLEILGNGEVHTIDVNANANNEILNTHPRIKRFFNGYEDYDLKLTKNFEKILIIDDGSHQYSDVMRAFEKFNKVVSVNSYYIIEDGILSQLGYESNYDGGPLRAIREITQKHSNFQIDRKWCDFFGKNATFNVNGFLKKVTD